MDLSYYILMPFSWMLTLFYRIFNSYGFALILFAVVVKLILFPFSLKGKRSMIEMNLISGKMQKLQKMYANNQQKYTEEVQKLYEKENINPMGGCLWSFLPILILFPLYAIIRQPMKYMMGMTATQIVTVANDVLNWAQVSIDNGWVRSTVSAAENLLTESGAAAGYNQLYLASLITPENLAAVKSAAGDTAREVLAINFRFFGIDLSLTPKLKFWEGGLSLQAVGLFLIPVISAATGVLFSMISMKTNQMNSQSQQNAQTQSTNRTMMLITPLMSLWIGFTMTASLSIYWIANNLLGMAQEMVSARLLKKDYERAAAEAKRRAEEEKEEEKRLRREKAERRAKEAEEAKKNRGKKKPKEPDGEDTRISAAVREASRVGVRQYARGRAYDPNRFGGVTPYYGDAASKTTQEETSVSALEPPSEQSADESSQED